jgi:hypothetical protein
VICFIPVYNIGGFLNRSRTSRANQNGPKEYGFRGNARNYDLNRDFIKADSRNALAFAEIFTTVQPHFFIDNHVTNGADYQYIMTYIATQHQKLGGKLGSYFNQQFMPQFSSKMTAAGFEMTPYYNTLVENLDYGLVGFNDYPRYSSGYTALFQTMSFISETHMLKPYNQRVKGTYQFMKNIIDLSVKDAAIIKQAKLTDQQMFRKQDAYPTNLVLDRSKRDKFNFKGYTSENRKSDVTGLDRLFYDRTRPFQKDIPFYNTYNSSLTISKPKFYIIPQSLWPVIERFKANKVEMKTLKKDTAIETEAIYIEDYKTSPRPFEGHYLHTETKVKYVNQKLNFRAGDFLVSTDQPAVRFLMETLEPSCADSYFNWNFFDVYLQQKEHFSSYIFEDTAVELLKKDPDLAAEFRKKQQTDTVFVKDSRAQLDWIYKRSAYYEKEHMRMPYFRVR